MGDVFPGESDESLGPTSFNGVNAPDVPTNRVPEPGSLALLGLGLAALAASRLRKVH